MRFQRGHLSWLSAVLTAGSLLVAAGLSERRASAQVAPVAAQGSEPDARQSFRRLRRELRRFRARAESPELEEHAAAAHQLAKSMAKRWAAAGRPDLSPEYIAQLGRSAELVEALDAGEDPQATLRGLQDDLEAKLAALETPEPPSSIGLGGARIFEDIAVEVLVRRGGTPLEAVEVRAQAWAFRGTERYVPFNSTTNPTRASLAPGRYLLSVHSPGGELLYEREVIVSLAQLPDGALSLDIP